MAVALDIDVFKQGGAPQEEPEMWEYFETLRSRKNEVFEACISDAMRERLR